MNSARPDARSDARRDTRFDREAGILPRPLVYLAALALAASTGAALWLLPATARPDHEATAPEVVSIDVAVPSAPPATAAPAGYRAFLDASDGPAATPAAAVRRYTIGHITAAADGCTPRWAGRPAPGRIPVADRLAALRARGGDADLAFGGPYGPELAASCPDAGRLLAAYRKMIAAFHPAGFDFEVRDAADPAATRRRAVALARLQREARDEGGRLPITFTLPAAEHGLAQADLRMLRAVRSAGVEIDAVNLLIPCSAGLRGLAAGARAAHEQLQVALNLGDASAWRRIALTPVLADPRDLGVTEARRLAAFRARHGLAWLSTRGAQPSEAVVREFGRERTRPIESAGP